MKTIRSISEQVTRLLVGGNVRSSSNIHLKEVQAAVVQAIAAVLKLEAVNLSKELGGVPFSMVATYEGIEVNEVDDCNSVAELPIQPVSLPYGQGVWQVYTPDCPEKPFVPILVGAAALVMNTTHSGMKDMLGELVIGYEPVGKSIKIKRPKSDIGDTVTVQLLVADPSKMGPDDFIPLPNDLELVVIDQVVKLFSRRPRHDDSNDGKDNAV